MRHKKLSPKLLCCDPRARQRDASACIRRHQAFALAAASVVKDILTFEQFLPGPSTRARGTN